MPPRTEGAQPGDSSIRHPMREPVYRELWSASLVSNIGTWMQSVGGAWLMVTLTTSSLPVALMQTATSLPVFLVGIPAGTLADRLDRRRMLLATQTWMLLCAAVLGALALFGTVSPPVLLLLTFALGIGSAMNNPVWQSTIPEVVSRPQVPAAIAFNSVGFNTARSIGPALAGIVVAAFGPAVNFLLNAASFLGTIGVLLRWRPAPEPRLQQPRAPLLQDMLTGLRYARESPIQRVVLGRSMLFMVCASSLWALLPLVARQELRLDAPGYGFLLTCTGAGAVTGGLLLSHARSHLRPNQLLAGATVLFAAMLLTLAWVRVLPIVWPMLAVGGMAWITSNANYQIAVQMSAPSWVRARAIATYVLTFQGGQAIGGALWGSVADRVGDPMALTFAAVGLGVNLLAALRWPIVYADPSRPGH